jgi:hypothetical protein
MNERIKELWELACTRYSVYETLKPQDERKIIPDIFAELIVAECMTTILKESKWYWDKDEFESSNAVRNAARRVKEHFGVKR